MQGSKCHGLRSAGLLLLRLLAGIAMATHGYQKVFGGQEAMLQQGLVQMGFPAPTFFAWAASLAEFLGGLSIALGLLTRVGAAFVLIDMLVAIFKAHAADPFHVKEPAYLYAAIAGALILTGAGRFSLDALFCRRCDPTCETKDPNR